MSDWYDPETGEDVSPWTDDEVLAQRVQLKRQRAESLVADLDRMEEVEVPEEAQELLDEADELDDDAKHNEELAGIARTDQARKRLLWEANQLHGRAVRRWVEAQRIISPARQEVFRVGAVVTYADDDVDYGEPDPAALERIRQLNDTSETVGGWV